MFFSLQLSRHMVAVVKLLITFFLVLQLKCWLKAFLTFSEVFLTFEEL